MQKVTINISLTLIGPLLTQASNPGELGLDIVIARHQDNNKTPYLPGTLVTGKLRQAFEELDNVTQQQGRESHWFKPAVTTWLGQRGENGFSHGKQLYFSDFNLEENDFDKMIDLVRDRITIEQDTGAVKPRHIVMIENPFMSGQNYTFTGKLHFFSKEDEVDTILQHVKTGFNWFSQIGALKSVGFGQVSAVKFSSLQKTPILPRITTPNAIGTRITLKIKPLYPFCLSGTSIVNNLFESEAIISGGAIIGSIASTWSHLLGDHNGRIINDPDRKALQENFSYIRITHAFPAQDSVVKRPVVAPLSLVKVGGNQLYDVAMLGKPCLIDNIPPDFSLDWKDDENTLTEYPWPFIRMKNWGWAPLKSELRVRTAIDRNAHRSKKNELFAYEQIIPDNTCWYANLDLSRISDNDTRVEVFAQLESLLEHGFIGLGKTKTPVSVELVKQDDTGPYFQSHISPKENNQWIIVLQTDMLLGTPKSLSETSGEKELTEMYANAWATLSDSKLKLVRYFARQKQFGGRYQKMRFKSDETIYRPWLLTEAGSVFVLQSSRGDAPSIKEDGDLIKKWLNEGVPLSNTVCDYYKINNKIDEQWKECPYLPQNGYGEIAVNLDTDEQVIMLSENDRNITLIQSHISAE